MKASAFCRPYHASFIVSLETNPELSNKGRVSKLLFDSVGVITYALLCCLAPKQGRCSLQVQWERSGLVKANPMKTIR